VAIIKINQLDINSFSFFENFTDYDYDYDYEFCQHKFLFSKLNKRIYLYLDAATSSHSVHLEIENEIVTSIFCCNSSYIRTDNQKLYFFNEKNNSEYEKLEIDTKNMLLTLKLT